MSRFRYQANFCAECGNPLEPIKQSVIEQWRFRYFCDSCKDQQKQFRLLKPLAAFLTGALALIFTLSYKHNPRPSITAPDSFAVSASDATAIQRIAMPRAKAADGRVLCGARTKKGTPCRHLVQPGQRCAQHRGLPSILVKPSAKLSGQ